MINRPLNTGRSRPFSCRPPRDLDVSPRPLQPPEQFTARPAPPERLLVTASFGRILPNSLLELFLPGRRLNVHPSLLPMYRGPAPIQRALLDGQKETGVCVIEMMEKKKGIDAGEIWGRRHMVRPSLLVCDGMANVLSNPFSQCRTM